MKKVAREAAIGVLTPVVKKAATGLTKQLATKGPELYQEYIEPRIEEAGGVGELAKKVTDSKGLKGMAVGKAAESVMDKVTGGRSGGGKADGTGRGRRLPIQEAIDVGVPIDVAYNEWTQFEQFPEFMHRVEQIEQIDDTHLVWHENIWGRRRKWKAEITDQTPNERIAWRSEDGAENVGVITFHDLGDRLTRILVNLDFQPKGLMEKTASGFRMSRRALRSDLMRFKAHIEMQDEEEGAWRGTVEDGEVTDYDEDYENPRDADDQDADDQDADDQSDEDQDDDQSDEYEDEEGDEEEPDEASDEYDEDEGDEDEPDEQSDEADEEDELAPRRRRSSTRKSSAGRRPARKVPAATSRSGSRKASASAGTAKRTAKKASSPARKASSRSSGTAKRTAKKASSPARKAASPSGTAKRTTKKAASSSGTAKRTAKKASSPARKAASSSGTAKRTAKKASSPARKATSRASGTAKRTAKKTAPTRKTAASATKK